MPCYTCPTCGGPLGDAPDVSVLLDIQTGPMRERIIKALVERYPNSYSLEQMIEIVWFYGIYDEPVNAANVLAVHIHKCRRLVEEYGWTIPRNKTGWTVGRYRLLPLNRHRLMRERMASSSGGARTQTQGSRL